MFDSVTTQVRDLFKASLPIAAVDNPSTEEASLLEAFANDVSKPLGLPLTVFDGVSLFRSVAVGEGGVEYEPIDLPGFTPDPYSPGETFLRALSAIGAYEGVGVFVVVDMGHFIAGDRADASIVRALKVLAHTLRRSRKRLVLLGQGLLIPDELTGLVAELANELPDALTLSTHVRAVLDDLAEDYAPIRDGFSVALSDEAFERLVRTCQGLTLAETSDALRLAAVADGVINSATAERVNTQKIRKLERLNVEFCGRPTVEAAGLVELKGWITRKGARFHNPTPTRPAPKGLMLVGVPGAGKSLIAKTIGTLWGVPVLSVDMGSIYGSLVGESEARLRQLLETAEAVAPCVLFLDEVEKALAGVNSSSDSGVSQRLFGKLLSWMSDKTASVFVVATANNIAGLPPEFTRKGRFDEIFFVDLPNETERDAILRAHLARYGVSTPSALTMEVTVADTEGFSGAELAAVVEEALDLMDSSDDVVLLPSHLMEATAATVPYSRRNPDALTELRAWAATSARRASAPVAPSAKPSASKKAAKPVMLG